MAQPEIPGNGLGIPRMPYGFDGSNWIALLVDALGRLQIDAEVGNFPADPATQTTLALCLVALQKIDDLQNALGTVANDLLRVESKDGDKLFGYETTYTQRINEPNATVDSDTLRSTVVPPGEVHVYTTIGAFDATTNIDRIFLLHVTTAGNRMIAGRFPTAIFDPVVWSGWLVVKAGDGLGADFEGTVAGDDIYLDVSGFVMNEP